MKILLACLLLLPAFCFGQDPATPFHLNLRVVYSGVKAHPDLAAFIYKSLRELPGVGIVDIDPDATLVIGENNRGNQYACTFTVISLANPDVQVQADLAINAYNLDRIAERSDQQKTDVDAGAELGWQKKLKDGIKAMQPMYYFEGGWIGMHESPKAALQQAIKAFDLQYVEKQRRSYQYNATHPIDWGDYTSTSKTPTATPTPVPARLPLYPPEPSDTPEPLLGPDPFPKK